MLTKTKVVVAAALIFGTASEALANDFGENNMGGSAMPGEAYGYAAWPRTQPDDGSGYAAWPQTHPGDAYGYAASPKQTHQRVSHARTWDR
jgi:hypothetical protein